MATARPRTTTQGTPDDGVPAERIAAANGEPVRPERAMVLYWMIAARRTRWSHALQRAVGWSRALGRPLVVLEGLRCGHRWACDRFHAFAIAGMRDQREACARAGVTYLPYVEPSDGAGKGLLATLAKDACVVVTDEWPAFFLPRMVASAARQLDVRLETVDGNGLLPLRAVDRAFERAVDFRRALQRELPSRLGTFPQADPLRGAGKAGSWRPARAVAARWPIADIETLLAPGGLSSLPIDHRVPPSPIAGGARAGARVLARFVDQHLPNYLESRRDLDAPGTSGLSPYLHWGHVGAHQAVAAVLAREGWSPERLDASGSPRGAREGWWGLTPPAEAFLDQLVTWRELGFNAAAHGRTGQGIADLPRWAAASLKAHADDPRAPLPFATLEDGRTGDAVWDAAQHQLLDEGVIHNQLRMLWGKRVLPWSRSPAQALSRLFAMNDRWALDGRDPNSISGILWTLGRYDRPWPTHPVFGAVRLMTSGSAARKLRMKAYLARWRAP